MDLTPRQTKILHIVNTGPWPFGITDQLDPDFNELKERGLIVLRGGRVDTTNAGETLAEHLAKASRNSVRT